MLQRNILNLKFFLIVIMFVIGGFVCFNSNTSAVRVLSLPYQYKSTCAVLLFQSFENFFNLILCLKLIELHFSYAYVEVIKVNKYFVI